MNEKLGYCKECGNAVTEEDEILNHEGVYECSKCGHPSTYYELWDEVPYYITNK